MRYHFKRRSENKKTGPIAVTMTEQKSCSPSCAFNPRTGGGGCYGYNWPVVLHWNRIPENGIDLDALCLHIQNLNADELWRHDVVGDLDHTGGYINRRTLEKLTEANKGKRGFTYTHHDLKLGNNAAAVKKANDGGFIINASCESPEQASHVWDEYKIPAVCVVPEKEERKTWLLPTGHRVVRCPAIYREDITCSKCKMCSLPSRRTIIAFNARSVS